MYRAFQINLDYFKIVRKNIQSAYDCSYLTFPYPILDGESYESIIIDQPSLLCLKI